MFKLSHFRDEERKIKNHKAKSFCHMQEAVHKQPVHFDRNFPKKSVTVYSKY